MVSSHDFDMISLPVPRSREENQERAFVAASRRKDRSLDARLQSAHRASALHKKRTGRALRITKEIVEKEAMYEEVDECYHEKRIRMLQAQNLQIEEQFQRHLLATVAISHTNANGNVNATSHFRRGSAPTVGGVGGTGGSSTGAFRSPHPMRPQRNMSLDFSAMQLPLSESMQSVATVPNAAPSTSPDRLHYPALSGTCDPSILPPSYTHHHYMSSNMNMNNMHVNMNLSAADTMLFGIPSPPAESMLPDTSAATPTTASGSPDELPGWLDASNTSSLPPSSYLMPSLLNSSMGSMDGAMGVMPLDYQWPRIRSPSPTPDSTLDPLTSNTEPGSPGCLSGESPFLLSCDPNTLPSSYMGEV